MSQIGCRLLQRFRLCSKRGSNVTIAHRRALAIRILVPAATRGEFHADHTCSRSLSALLGHAPPRPTPRVGRNDD